MWETISDFGFRIAGVLPSRSFRGPFRFRFSPSPLDDLLRRAAGDDVAAFGAGFGAEVDDPVGRFDHVEVVFDDDDRVAVVDEAVEHVEQLGEVVEMQAGGRFVEQVERLAGIGPRELGRQLDALGLAAGERRARAGRA